MDTDQYGLEKQKIHAFAYGEWQIEYELWHSNRKTLEIAVHPDGAVVVKAPENTEHPLIEKKLRRRARWILRQQSYFRQFFPRTPERCFVNGETHLYLGRHYRLKSRQGAANSVKLNRATFLVTCTHTPTPDAIKELMQNWYQAKAREQFSASLESCWDKFKLPDSEMPELSVRHMKKRWGSLSDKGTLTLNTQLVKAPRECIDYVVTHELCHLRFPDHSPDFYNLLESALPDWKKLKHKLELSLI